MLGTTPEQKTFDLPGLNPVVIKGHSRSAKKNWLYSNAIQYSFRC